MTAQYHKLIEILEIRFHQTMHFHPSLAWPSVLAALEHNPKLYTVLQAMESTGGQPNVIEYPQHPKAITFTDCSPESPAGRRSLCYDQEALLSRKTNPPKSSALQMAEEMGIRLLSEYQYRHLESMGDFDLKTSSWIHTPESIHNRGGALFCDHRYGQVFTYHNGAGSYYASRGFRGYIAL